LDGKTFWWDILSQADSGLDDAFRARALTDAHGLNGQVLELARAAGMRENEVPPHASGASSGQLADALEFSGITLAAHTSNHPNLVSLDDGELMNELAQPLEWLKQYGERALPMVSYPYGLADRRVMDASHDAGYHAGFMIEGGWTSPRPSNPFAIPRLNVPAGVSRAGFVLRAAGVIKS
ncbi:MAG: polysaccharide deacetylase family protein, partial [Gemmatimonadaceae bacterium]